jgi:nucleotide-binding universal stress UspA family protein
MYHQMRRGESMYRKILLAFDGSQAGHEALRQGADLAILCGAEVVLVAVVSPDAGIVLAESVAPSGIYGAQYEDTERALRDGAQELRDAGVPVQTCLCEGNAALEIGRVARERQVDLIVVGHREQGRLARWWRGSTGTSLLTQITCSLLVAVAGATAGRPPG